MNKYCNSSVSLYSTGWFDDSVKDLSYENLQWTLTKISASENLFVNGNFNGYIGKNADGYEGFHGGTGFGRRNLEGERILEFSVAHNLVISNSLFTKREGRLVTYISLVKIKVKLITSWSGGRISNSTLCESHPKWRECNPAQTTCLWWKNCKK